MTTAVDTSVLFDLFSPNVEQRRRARVALEAAYDEGNIIIGEVVYAELMPQFRSVRELDGVLAELHIRFVSSSVHSAAAAGQAWGNYRKRGGPRNRLIADLLVGAHALLHADRLLSRDQRFYRGCFSQLHVVEP